MALTSGVFIDPQILSEVEILEIYKAALALVREGKTLMSWQGEGVNTSKQFTAPVMDILREARLALKAKNPSQYGYISNRSKVYFY